jgi:glycosyltransferase involved in cell wall biosynthesis
MNVVHILDNLDRGGAQKTLRLLVAGLSARGYRQHVICLNEKFNPQVLEALQQAGTSVEIIGRPRLYGLVGFWHIVRELRRRRPDVVHTKLPWGDLIGRTAARLAGAGPIVSTVTTRHVDKPRLQLVLDRMTVRWAERVVFVSAEIIPFSVAHEGVRPNQVQCIPNGIDPDNRDRTVAAAGLRRQYGGGARAIIGMVARLHPQKAHGDLLTAFARVASASRDVRLWLVGDGPERGRLDSQVRRLGLEERVFFAGDRDDVLDWVAAMDVFVHPTFFEGLPSAVLEAMVMAKPVIASPVDGIRGLMTPGVHGWLVKPGDIEGLAGAIRHVLDHPELAAQVARAGAERVRKEFSAERFVQAYDDLFQSLVRARSHPVAIARR